MRSLRAIPLFLLWLALPAVASDHTPPPVQPATTFAAVEVHDDEKVAIAVEPYDTRERESIFRSRLSEPRRDAGAPDRDQQRRPAHLSARCADSFLTAAGDKIPAAEPEDVERLMTRKERQGSKIPMPGPIPNIKLKPKASNKEIEEDFDTFEYQALVVEPHTTRAGFLFYDVSRSGPSAEGRQDCTCVKLRDADGNELFYFEIPFDKYLRSKSSQMN